jgi:hypothetical protein
MMNRPQVSQEGAGPVHHGFGLRSLHVKHH